MSVIDDVMKMYKASEDLYGYSLEAGYDNPIQSGVTNCSAWIRYVARVVEPSSQMAQMASSYTGVMARTGKRVANGAGRDAFPYDVARCGDLVLVSWNGHNPDYDHVEAYFGRDNPTGCECWGAGYAPAPHRTGDASAIVSRSYEWELRRIGWECDNMGNANHYRGPLATLQRFLTARHYYDGYIDGALDTDGYSPTILALQRYMGDRRYYHGLFDGRLDEGESLTVRALQSMLQDMDLYSGELDGKIDAWGSMTMEALEGLPVWDMGV